MEIQNDEEALLTTIDIAHTSVAALSRVVEQQAQLIHQLTAPRPSQAAELVQALPVIMQLVQSLLPKPVGPAERRARAAFDVKHAELVRDLADDIADARAADQAKPSEASAA